MFCNEVPERDNKVYWILNLLIRKSMCWFQIFGPFWAFLVILEAYFGCFLVLLLRGQLIALITPAPIKKLKFSKFFKIFFKFFKIFFQIFQNIFQIFLNIFQVFQLIFQLLKTFLKLFLKFLDFSKIFLNFFKYFLWFFKIFFKLIKKHFFSQLMTPT